MHTPFLGSEAVAAGTVRKHELRNPRGPFVAVFPDVYTDRGREMTMHERATAAWLWSHRQGVIAGLSASALHGAQYVDDAHPVELIWSNRRPPRGIVTLKGTVDDDDVIVWRGLPFTSLLRTAFDLGRRGPLDEAVARLDALGNATRLRADDAAAFASRHRGARGMRQLITALGLYDSGAQSPKETWLRLLLIRAGYPRPTTQIPVTSADGRRQYYLDMGWEDHKLAVEYDGDHHRKDPVQFANDIIRSEHLDELGWTRVRVAKRHSADDVLARVARVWAATVHSDREIA
ncbi:MULTISPECIES: endonuclease domain-containing protein [Mycolicibacterium]|uniref:Cullin, a subunit of E3 ubiquitin ligase n=1 Tax=Mycolicibacterium senegalense TaxID=1796 RepID=A0A378T0R4_9MYCO|nr:MULTISPECIES: DUF559 domain-containing protein [Mycolicibacterium]MCV7334605.1 DUF559 domain-containing protein [Mycolicibacterium senegalense]MDR7291924.1 hypothetical protein [Mycolicibacterium senegalense]QZA23353.1 DUF559 domain-containing protein [Mycolicibacterium senegalense]CDP89685.1 hypothetical protein BN975_05547 [Mycolicibacterium farcinogenes]STZ53076.1 cullin, a subunit of E3 ubiquitin ligase [Mycolicibacterium senegalense]